MPASHSAMRSGSMRSARSSKLLHVAVSPCCSLAMLLLLLLLLPQGLAGQQALGVRFSQSPHGRPSKPLSNSCSTAQQPFYRWVRHRAPPWQGSTDRRLHLAGLKRCKKVALQGHSSAQQVFSLCVRGSFPCIAGDRGQAQWACFCCSCSTLHSACNAAPLATLLTGHGAAVGCSQEWQRLRALQAAAGRQRGCELDKSGDPLHGPPFSSTPAD